MSNELAWSDECQAKWLLAHEYAADRDTKGALCSLLTLILALQKAQPHGCDAAKLVPHIAQRLRDCESPIYLLARDPPETGGKGKQQYSLPTIDRLGNVAFQSMPFQLYVQLENFAQHNEIVLREWKTKQQHIEALGKSGF